MMNLCPHCERQVSLGKTGKVLSHSGPRKHKPNCGRTVSGSCVECGLAVYKDGRRCLGTYKRPAAALTQGDTK